MLSSTANFNSFYTVSKGIRRLTLLNFSKAKSLLPVNLPRVNKTYITTNSQNFDVIFLNHFNFQLKKDVKDKIFLFSMTLNQKKSDIECVLLEEFNDVCAEFFEKIEDSTKSSYKNIIFYCYAMNKNFFVRASVRLCQIEINDISSSSNNATNSHFTGFIRTILPKDKTITNINYIGFYGLATNEVLKEEDFQRIKISL
jgi:hypothetical protein